MPFNRNPKIKESSMKQRYTLISLILILITLGMTQVFADMPEYITMKLVIKNDRQDRDVRLKIHDAGDQTAKLYIDEKEISKKGDERDQIIIPMRSKSTIKFIVTYKQATECWIKFCNTDGSVREEDIEYNEHIGRTEHDLDGKKSEFILKQNYGTSNWYYHFKIKKINGSFDWQSIDAWVRDDWVNDGIVDFGELKVKGGPVCDNVVTNRWDDGDEGTLRKVIDKTPDGGVIIFDTSDQDCYVYEPIEISGKSITIDGELPGGENVAFSPLIHDVPLVEMFNIDENATLHLKNMNFTSFNASGIKNSGKLTLDSCEFRSNSTDGFGGAICQIDNPNAELTINDCTFENNEAKISGGAIAIKDGWFRNIKDSCFEGNSCDSTGGALYLRPVSHTSRWSLDIKNTKINYNIAGGNYYAIYNAYPTNMISMYDGEMLEDPAQSDKVKYSETGATLYNVKETPDNYL